MLRIKMKKSVVLAEKPSVGRDLARVLGCRKKGNGFMEGDKYIVTWAFGHLVTLAEPEAYDKKYKVWRMEDLPILPQPLKQVVIRKTSKQFHQIKKLMSRPDVKNIVIATDAGREGELVARWIIEKARVKKPVKRLWISSVTDKAIKEGFKKLKDGKLYENLYRSAVARAEADWVVGINATRALTSKYNASLSCGRVQTPTLAMIARREEEIKNFRPKPFYGVEAVTDKGLKFTWKKGRSFRKEICENIVSAGKGKKLSITHASRKKKKKWAPALYDLTELQREANQRYGFSAKETLSTLQQLYETHKVVTYPRTDSRYLSSDIVDTLKERIEACRVGPYAEFARQAKQGVKAGAHFVDDRKVSDHHAIIPTEEPVRLEDLSPRGRKIFDLVVRRFFAVLFPPFEYEEIKLEGTIGGEPFIAGGKTVLSPGWKQVAGSEPEADMNPALSRVQPGEELTVRSLKLTQGETEPPERFTEGTLIAAMENPVKYMETDRKDLIKTIGETGGLGTVATRADIIEKLFDSYYIEKKGKYIYLTSTGRQLLDLVPEELKSPELTAKWEQKLQSIANGKLKKDSFLREMRDYAKRVVHEIKASERTFRHDNLTATRCPDCGKRLLEVKNKKGRMLVCQDRSCGYRKNLARITNVHCPECRKRMELRGEGEGRIFVCSCGFREKYASFKERMEKEQKSKVSRKEINRYLKQQEELSNPALKEALSKLFSSNE